MKGPVVLAHHSIGHFHESWLDDAMKEAPFFKRPADAMRHVYRCIHSLKDMHRLHGLTELEIYLGRATRGSLRQRWSSHAKDAHRRHQCGAILFRCDAARDAHVGSCNDALVGPTLEIRSSMLVQLRTLARA